MSSVLDAWIKIISGTVLLFQRQLMRCRWKTLLFLCFIILCTVIFTLKTLKPSQLNSNFHTKDCTSWRRTSQHKSTLISRSKCIQHYFLLILVSSAPGHFDRRKLIRKTWGSDSTNKPRWKTYFLLGQTINQTQSGLLLREEAEYKDTIRANYFEDYWNQTLKIEMGFEWAARYCNFSFLLKADDDVFVSTNDLINLLQASSTPKERLYMGKVHVNPEVRRHGKYNVTYNEYSQSNYPNYCGGAGFVLSYDVLDCFVALFEALNPLRIDDTYVGILAYKSGLTPIHHDWFRVPYNGYEDCYYVPNTILQHRVLGDCLIMLYNMHSQDFHGSNLGSFF